jgi:hypothetical protein
MARLSQGSVGWFGLIVRSLTVSFLITRRTVRGTKLAVN